MPLLLPPNPSLRHLRLQVDDLLKAFAQGEHDAIETIREYLPESLENPSQPLKRAQAQHILARQYGFESWPKLKHYVDANGERVEAESLCESIKHGHLDSVRRTIEDDPSLIEAMTGWGMTPLYCAARWGTPECVKLLLEYGADPNVRQGAPMFDSRNIESLRLMLQHGGDATLLHDEHTAHRMSLLHVAALRNDVSMLELILSHGARIHLNTRLAAGNEGRYAGQTPLQVAAKARSENAAETLIAHGADYDVFSAACLGDKTKLLSVDQGVLGELDVYGNSVLHWAVEAVQGEIVNLLLDRGANIDAENAFGETPLLLASTHDANGADRRSLVSLLIARGARIDVLAAAAIGDIDHLREMHARDPLSIQRKSAHGWTALHWAARNGHLDAARELMDWGCDVNAADAIGWTPLFPAAYWGQHAEIVRLLAERGADLNHRDRFNHPVTDYDTGVAVGEVLRQLR